MSTYSYQSNPPMDGTTKAEAAGTFVVMLASPFVATAAVNSIVYGAPLMSSANLIIPAGMIGGNMIFPGFGGLAGGVGAAMYFAQYPLSRALVIGVGAGLVEVVIGMTILEAWMKKGSQ